MYVQKSVIGKLYLVYFLMYVIISCKEEAQQLPVEENPAAPANIKGTADITFDEYLPLKDKPIQLFYHIPANATVVTPILFVFHGLDRDAKYSRDAMIGNADKYGFIIIAPQFSDQYYPNANAYNLGNVFKDGENPSASTLNTENLWTFSAVEPIFTFMKDKIGSTANTYDVFGHSAGAQFVHRYLLFKPLAKINRLVTASSGWYTMFDKTIDFPYGTKMSPAENANYSNLFNKKVYVLVGDKDTDPNSADLRHNDIVDKQGLNRYERAQYFYIKSREEANARSSTFNWKYYSLNGVAHNFIGTSNAAAIFLYQ
jgi:hypothetical protein